MFACSWKCGWRSRCTHTMRAHTCVSVVVCVARKLRPCPSYSRCRDRNNSVHWRSSYRRGGVIKGSVGAGPRIERSHPRCTMCGVRVGGAHTRRSVATARVLLFKGCAGASLHIEQSEPRCRMCGAMVGGVHTRWCTHKVVCGHRKSFVISGGCKGWPPRRAKQAELFLQAPGGCVEGGGGG